MDLGDDREAPVQRAKLERVVQVVTVDSPIPSMDEFDIMEQANMVVHQHLSGSPELQEILDVLNIIRQQGKSIKI